MYYRNKPLLPDNFLPVHPFDNGFVRNSRDEDLAAFPRTESAFCNASVRSRTGFT